MKKTKKVATALLILALLGAVISWPFRTNFWGGLALTAFEASLVGALADWFAISALFRHPLGLKFIPHTAIIPNNKGRIIDSIVYLVEDEWLKIDILKEKINKLEFVDMINNLMHSEEGQNRLREIISSVVSNTLSNINSQEAAMFTRNFIKQNEEAIILPTGVVERVEKSAKELYGEDIIDLFIEGAKKLIDTEEFSQVAQNTLRKSANDYSQSNVLRRLGKGFGERLDIINYNEAAESIVKRLGETLENMKSEYNPYRIKIRRGIMQYQLTERVDIAGVLNNGIKKLVDSDAGQRVLINIIDELKNQTRDFTDSSFIQYITNIVLAQIEQINNDIEKKNQVEDWIKNEALSLVERYHGIIGNLVRENLESLNDEGFVISLEERVGDDLQWIRINGTVIGGIVGILQYLILHLIIR